MRTPTWIATLLLALFAALLGPAPLRAQGIEGVLMPGKVIAGHAKLENDCANCHVKFDRAAQDRLCLDCHKPVAADVRNRTGYHGRIRIDTCRTCHTEHKGREMNIAAFDTARFEHARTDFALGGAHARAKCESCHTAGRKFRDAPARCNDCHHKDDVHRGQLGADCTSCHSDSAWKPARFDHARTRFALTGKHADATCKSCHVDQQFKGTPLACASCHRKDDRHHGRLGDRCDACHVDRGWREVTFSHDRDTRYPLRGQHRSVKCDGCHSGPPASVKAPTVCVECHRKDDKHNTTLGADCASCHVERGWRETRIDHDATAFPLRDKHRDVECKECHRDASSFKGIGTACIACHRKDDTHKERFGERCASCHVDRGWREVTFAHDRDTRYALTGRHASVKCVSCHTGFVYRDKLATTCVSCHRADDKHKGELGERCEQCHDTPDWKKTRFDHSRSRFPLLGRHAVAACKDCHTTPAYRDAQRECIACHARDDKHKGTLGRDCAECHNARSWTLWDFEHNRRTRFLIDGAHERATCASCHKALASDKTPRIAMACESCHHADDVHERRFGTACERCHTTRNFRDVRPGARMAPRVHNGEATP
ncbi:MAG TPA: cytochrome C [Casimicrobiaceae bacterium]|nr:cytochrome C [Casimicrobiaceae bacterium]